MLVKQMDVRVCYTLQSRLCHSKLRDGLYVKCVAYFNGGTDCFLECVEYGDIAATININR